MTHRDQSLGPMVPSPFFDPIKEECERLNVVIGPAAAHAPAWRVHPCLLILLLEQARSMRAQAAAAEMKAALLVWGPEKPALPSKRSREKVAARQKQLRAENS